MASTKNSKLKKIIKEELGKLVSELAPPPSARQFLSAEKKDELLDSLDKKFRDLQYLPAELNAALGKIEQAEQDIHPAFVEIYSSIKALAQARRILEFEVKVNKLKSR